jgi:hypothetical protein
MGGSVHPYVSSMTLLKKFFMIYRTFGFVLNTVERYLTLACFGPIKP